MRTKNLVRGVGVGLRAPHFDYILEYLPPVPWFEVLIDNYMVKGGIVLQRLEQIRQRYPFSFHGVGLSLGSVDPLCMNYLAQLKKLKEWLQPAYLSDHLCWTSVDDHYLHELLPLPYNKVTLDHLVSRISKVQDFLGERILIENVSSYLSFQDSDIYEWDFINEVVRQADCYLLLDINNVYVSSYNHGFDAKYYLDNLAPNRVKQYHLAGHENFGRYLLDAHSKPVSDGVWELYQYALRRFGALPTIIEWDNDIPSWDTLIGEALKAQSYQEIFSENII